MGPKNACEGIFYDDGLRASVHRQVISTYRKNQDLMRDSSIDPEDLEQELMLELCEEAPQPEERYYRRLATDRLKDIIIRLGTSLSDGNGGYVDLVQLSTLPLEGNQIQSPEVID